MTLKPDTRDTRKRRKSAITPMQLIELGKLPPQAVDLEEAVLGAMMLDKNALSQVIDIFTPETFYKEAHQRIFSAIHYLFHDSEPADILTVTQRLKKQGELDIAGGAFYVTQLTNRIASAANIEVHSRIIIEKFIQREVIRISTDILQGAYEDTSDVFDLLEKAEQGLFSVTQNTTKKGYESIRTLMPQAIEQIENSRDQKFHGVPSGFTRLDSITGGWQKADLIILGARPSQGKTVFAVTIARNASVGYSKPVAIFSLEMTAIQLVNRLICAEAEFTSEKIRNGDFSGDDFKMLNERIAKLVNAPLFIDDTPALSIFEFRAKAKRLKSKENIELIVIDYLQLMTAGGNGKHGNREQEVSLISRSLKVIAKELDVPIIALSQLSRALEQRSGTGKRPQLSDLRESGAVEQDADVVAFIHRPEHYGILEDEHGNSTKGVAEIIIAKHRNGKLGSENLMFIQQYMKFVEPSEILYKSEDASTYVTGNTNIVDL